VKDRWLVLKFGGTSVSGRRQWDTIATLARRRLDDGNRVLLVCSAVSGITNTLQTLGDRADRFEDGEVTAILDRHRQLSGELGVDAEDLVNHAGGEIKRLLKKIANAWGSADRYAATASLLSFGEWLSTRIGERFLKQSLALEWVDAREALQALNESNPASKRAWLSARCRCGPDETLANSWAAMEPVLITQGYVAAHPAGGTALLGRGGSDTTAALLASRLGAGHIEIWTDVPGLFSADPRVVPGARLLQYVSYDEALEMAASGAKVVHSRCIRAAAESGIPIRIHDLENTRFCGTVIRTDGEGHKKDVEGIRGVLCQAQMAVLLLQNLDTREHVGFLARVFAQISEAGISIDLVATSETTTTVAINRASNHLDDAMLETLAEKLRDQCAVTVYPWCSGINLVGRGARMALATIDPESAFFAHHPLLMLSQSANDLCISLLVHSENAGQLLEMLHGELISKRIDAGHRAEIFGPTWQDIPHLA